MSTNRCCGNCKHFKDEDVNGFGLCGKDGVITRYNTSCSDYSSKFNGWTEITPDNVDEIRENKRKIVIMNPREWSVPEMSYGISKETLVLYSVWGGYYYYVLPELKIDYE